MSARFPLHQLRIDRRFPEQPLAQHGVALPYPLPLVLALHTRSVYRRSSRARSMVSKYGKDFTVPKDFPSVLKAFTREVLRSQPGNIYEFGAAYFSELMEQSQQVEERGPQERLTPEEMEQVLVQLFREADVDGNNVLSLPEFKVTHSV